MRKEFLFKVKGHTIKVVNSWMRGVKLYVDGDLRDHDSSLFANGKIALVCAKLGDYGVLEINPLSSLFSVEIDAFLILNNSQQHVYSSHKRLSLTEQRTAQ
ncbi:hypothetical protein [Pseudoalteromonas porphyrae]|uniref:Uncharacterized protein n=2 Tax=Pseudoalteromonas TaxID=53246 RepID=A0A0N1MT86_9GAMM|nr:hypothetical protein [Pseudoalteromonas porphyrae]KPH63685.1 hypothetical protein ADS77_07100 [Pseudoalteromonas porphyrae]